MKRNFPRVHYEEMWSSYEKCREIVRQEWREVSYENGSNPIEIFKKKSKMSLVELKNWSNEEFSGREKKLEQLQNKLKDIKIGYNHAVNGEEITKVENQIDNILLDKEVYWKQRSRAD